VECLQYILEYRYHHESHGCRFLSAAHTPGLIPLPQNLPSQSCSTPMPTPAATTRPLLFSLSSPPIPSRFIFSFFPPFQSSVTNSIGHRWPSAFPAHGANWNLLFPLLRRMEKKAQSVLDSETTGRFGTPGRALKQLFWLRVPSER